MYINIMLHIVNIECMGGWGGWVGVGVAKAMRLTLYYKYEVTVLY